MTLTFDQEGLLCDMLTKFKMIDKLFDLYFTLQVGATRVKEIINQSREDCQLFVDLGMMKEK